MFNWFNTNNSFPSYVILDHQMTIRQNGNNVNAETAINSIDLLLNYCGDNCNHQVEGCTDANAVNYDENANTDDGSCLYPNDIEKYFTPIWDGFPNNAMAFYLNSVNLNDETWKSGDEIGVFDGDLCVGMVQYDSALDNIPTIFTSEDNPQTEEQDGFIAGNPIFYRFWDYSQQIEMVGVISSDDNNLFVPLEGRTVDLTVNSILGCLDEMACNYNPDTTIEEDCVYPEENECDCDGNVFDECGECGGNGIPENECDCDGNIIDECGECGGNSLTCEGCTDPNALNYDENALVDDGSCVYPFLGDMNNDGLYNVIDIVFLINFIIDNEYVTYGDLNQDGYNNVLDAIILINWILDGEVPGYGEPCFDGDCYYGWEDGSGTILGSYGNLYGVANVGEEGGVYPFDGYRMLTVSEYPIDGTPQAFIGWVTNISPGDEITACFYGYDTTPDGAPSMRIWGNWSENDDINAYAGSAGGNEEYVVGTNNGWGQTCHTFSTPQENWEEGEALVIQARLYSPSSASEPVQYFIDLLSVETNSNTAIIYVP